MAKSWSQRAPIGDHTMGGARCNWCLEELGVLGQQHMFQRSNVPPGEIIQGTALADHWRRQTGTEQALELGKLLFCSTVCTRHYRDVLEGK